MATKSYTTEELSKAKAENNARAASTPVYTDDYSGITGVY